MYVMTWILTRLLDVICNKKEKIKNKTKLINTNSLLQKMQDFVNVRRQRVVE